jgi:predicted ferric reductase
MRRHPSWRRTSALWTGLTLAAAIVPAIYFITGPLSAASKTGRAYAILAVAVLAPAISLILRHRWIGYRVFVLLSGLALTSLTVLGGLFIGIYFIPAACFALIALGTEALASPPVALN